MNMKSIVLALLLCVVLPLVKAACYIQEYETPVKFCQDSSDETWHPVGSTWRNCKCVDCDCTAKSMTCCDAMAKVDVRTAGCVVKYDYSKCTFDVFNPKDPKVNCLYSAVQK